MTVGTKVMTTEHPNSIGEVIRVNDAGDLTIQFTTAPRENLPFGHVGTEFWPVADQHLLIELAARLYFPVNEEPTAEAEKIEAISHDFAMRLSIEIGDDNLREAARLNATPEFVGCCASHNFCDANMVMHASMEAWGYLFDPEAEMSEEYTRVWNAAWDQAKEYGFDL